MSLQHSSEVKPSKPSKPVGCSVIDAQGREIEVTEEMIQKACETLEKSRQEAAPKKNR
ncbi:PA1571 family protein [Pseudomonas fontis]|uniref:Multifunctional fatty acid oxidation complex subunit alpha n=1 Tax=Pseudomonas fontis TaxID=2942633 RepID=A0ABT5NW36_9PSED|nr:PA1571 family protein [Pseudomonas fontis]MDD0976844.1 hypothetical protein [Pseudomonas fontis]MDD0992346.1 hypothetical protein [Pseudomonas fontis]